MMGIIQRGTVNGVGEGIPGEILTGEGDGRKAMVLRSRDRGKPNKLKV
jgi:hypothetical protein